MENTSNFDSPVRHQSKECVGWEINWIWLLPLILGVVTPFLATPFCDGDMNYYLPADHPIANHSDDYFWKREGWLLPMTQSHPEWPSMGVEAEFQVLPIGIAFNIVIGIAVWYCIWIIAWGTLPRLYVRFTSKHDGTKRSSRVADWPS